MHEMSCEQYYVISKAFKGCGSMPLDGWKCSDSGTLNLAHKRTTSPCPISVEVPNSKTESWEIGVPLYFLKLIRKPL